VEEKPNTKFGDWRDSQPDPWKADATLKEIHKTLEDIPQNTEDIPEDIPVKDMSKAKSHNPPTRADDGRVNDTAERRLQKIHKLYEERK